ncbi:hypothetical protein [Staphylococcus marylandisciuri]|uniref:hypothetical protein n=1 Tax=Staphylococcus marylandisciuri TaxID=2981529 RepID=UPI0021D231B0|nr:hypothetical protein [Staphylococcus marylandisciuri]
MSRGPQQRETGKPVSTSTASWGGPQQRETGKPVSTSTASWCGAPTKRYWDIMVFD